MIRNIVFLQTFFIVTTKSFFQLESYKTILVNTSFRYLQGDVEATKIWNYFKCMLTLEFQCIPVEVNIVLLWRTMSNRKVIHKTFQSFCLIHGTLGAIRSGWGIKSVPSRVVAKFADHYTMLDLLITLNILFYY